MRFRATLHLCFSLLLGCAIGFAESDVQFKADHYQHLNPEIIRGKGHTWLKKGKKEIFADEVEVDFSQKRATASGNVHIVDGETEIWCQFASVNLNGDDAILENATVVMGQLVLYGSSVKKLNRRDFEIEEGSYTNCNIDLLKTKDVAKCQFDWKLYGSHLSITLEKYAHVNDAIVYVKDVPIFYSPYFIAPVKTQRQSGFLAPSFRYNEALGNGISLPYFWALSPWQDLSINPTYYTRAGYHLGLGYRYMYSDSKRGEFNFYLLQKRFGAYREDRDPNDFSPDRLPGVGEWAINAYNLYSLGGRVKSRQTFRLMSDPYYTRDYGNDFAPFPTEGMPSLRSQISLWAPGDKLFFAAFIQYHQSLIVPRERFNATVDRGEVVQLPALQLSEVNTPFLAQLFSYEIDTQFKNYWRSSLGYDYGPLNPDTTNLTYQNGNYIRTGRRFMIQPRLIANIPMPPGLFLQPNIRFGALVYHFDYPASSVVHQEFAAYELPFTMYLSKRFSTGISGFENLNHVFQPRFIYARSPYQNREVNHPFFRQGDVTQSEAGRETNPRFDIWDQLTPFEYIRFELINRFLRKSEGAIERFFLIQVSQQLNLRTYPDDPRYAKGVGPIELLSEFKIWRFYAQLQANYQIEEKNGVRENDWSSSIEYKAPNLDRVKVNTRFQIRADDAATEKYLYVEWYKTLPLFFDVDGNFEYSLKRGKFLGYRFGLLFGSKPRNCWEFAFSAGRNTYEVPFVSFAFRLNFGNPTYVASPS